MQCVEFAVIAGFEEIRVTLRSSPWSFQRHLTPRLLNTEDVQERLR